MRDPSIQAVQIGALEDKLNEVIDKLNLLLRDYALTYDQYKRHVVKKIDLDDLDY